MCAFIKSRQLTFKVSDRIKNEQTTLAITYSPVANEISVFFVSETGGDSGRYSLMPVQLKTPFLSFMKWQEAQFISEIRATFNSAKIRDDLWRCYAKICMAQKVTITSSHFPLRFNKRALIWEVDLKEAASGKV